ncbi:hypothetical protein SASPL_132938 [Salvia splendens]|uniref:tRNA (guanosine(18)-2'-O)-methyltransferase TARBP1 n=1 Tax=Salvia splendens TaxID=180675 RepID=A0A8X8X363_SALSN|nr:hypothetical protein SASPL_132938 [Salvia splendens]
MDSEQCNSVATYVAALSHLVKKSGPHDMHIFVCSIWIPLLKLVYPCDRELFNEVSSLFLNLVKETNSWDVLEETMVPLLLGSVGLSMGMSQSEQFAIYKWSENPISNGSMDDGMKPTPLGDFHSKLIESCVPKDVLVCNSYCIPLHIACNILTLTLDAALWSTYENVIPESSVASGSLAKTFAGKILWDLSSLTLKMLMQSSEHRSTAIKFLLPWIFNAFAREYTFKVAVPGTSHVLTREDNFVKIWKSCKLLFVLGSLERRDAYDILSLYFSVPSPADEHKELDISGREGKFQLRDDLTFWDEIKRGLLDKESLLRKQSLLILKTILNLSKERKYHSDIFEEVSEEKGSRSDTMGKRGRWADKEAQSLGVGRICNYNEVISTGWYRWEAFVFLYEMLEEYGTHLVEAAWNHQIMLLLRSLPSENTVCSANEELYHSRMATAKQIFEWLAILWERGFFHDNPLGAKEIYSSWAIEASSRFLCLYSSYMEDRQHISFLVDLSLVPKMHSFGRAGLICLVECIAAAACRDLKPDNHDTDATSNVIIVCEKILAAAASVMCGSDVPLEILSHFISSLPREYTDYGGSLRYVVQKWLRGHDFQLLKALNGFPGNFLTYHQSQDSQSTFDDEELEAWGSEAKRWARVLFLVADSTEHIRPLFKFIEDHGHAIFKKNNSELTAVKFLILIASLIEELQVIKEKVAIVPVTRIVNENLNMPTIVDNFSFMEESIIFDKFGVVFLSFLEELMSFTKLSCSVFWSSVVIEDMALPGSIRGRLGGPSQRRLPCSPCTSVLEAITSVRTLASVLRWCVQYKTDGLVHSAESFLWKLCWKIITTPAPISEVEAEIRIAAYEACAYALKDLVSVFFPVTLDIMTDSDGLTEGLVDSDQDGGIVLGKHMATRKMSLSNGHPLVPFYVGCGIVETYRGDVYELSVKRLPGILVKSRNPSLGLENAGEISVLPMLRCVRLNIELLASQIQDPAEFFRGGISIEMMWLLVNSSWVLHINCNKRRVAPIAALLSSVLHQSTFGDQLMHKSDDGPGPMKWFVEKILEEGTKSPRTIRLAALHLCGLWLAYPNTLQYYIKELKLLTSYGSVAFDEDFEAELVENHDARAEVSLLSRSLDPELTDVFINTELYARVSVAVMFSKLADIAYSDKCTSTNEDKCAIISSSKLFLLELLSSVVNEKDLSKELYKKYSAIHRRKVRAWQMICALARFADLDIVEEVTLSLHTSIQRNNLPSVRQYMETFAIYMYLKFPLLVGQQLVPLLRNYDLRPQLTVPEFSTMTNVILHGEKIQSGHLDKLLPPIVPLLTSHHHTLRGFTQILLYHVLEKMFPDSNPAACSSMSLEGRCFVDLRYYLEHNSDCTRLRASMDSYLDSFDPIKSVSPAGIFTNRVEEQEFECVPATLMDRVIDFLNETREDLRSSMAKDAAAIQSESIHIDERPKCPETLDSNGGHSTNQLGKELLYDFQRKISLSKNEKLETGSATFLDKGTSRGSLLDMENEDHLLDQLLNTRGEIGEKLKASRQQIIIQASLIDRIPNLAGLARTCEVFKAAGLAIANKNVLNDKQFQLISVTADKWVPMMEVPVESMKVFLEKKKQQGFAILGLEQTAHSIPLDQYNFPVKTVLVLGREKEGIPVEIIHMLDACIEIPQLGIVRSLNVHVSGALALWEYTRQQR